MNKKLTQKIDTKNSTYFCKDQLFFKVKLKILLNQTLKYIFKVLIIFNSFLIKI
jgi:hypothetical protein